MRIRISHLTSYRYTAAAASMIQMLRLTPRNHEGQYIADWRIDVSADCRLDQHEDAFGNITHAFTADGPIGELSVLAEGEVETRDTQGIIRDTIERFPPSLYLRETSLTHPGTAIATFAAAARDAANGDVLTLLHCILDRLHEQVACDTDSDNPAATAQEAFARHRGSAPDLAHIFIAATRSLGIPARYVGGYLCDRNGKDDRQAGHAWAEAFVPELGWVAFDAADGNCPTDAHVRVAVGLDCLGAAPLRGTCHGGGGEVRTIKIVVDQAGQQTQN